MQNRIYKTELVEWQKVKDLQPDNLKLPYNYEHIKKSILKHGISKAYDVCELEGELYWIDGHTRTQILNELVSDGVNVPKMLTANFCRVKDRKEAIEILLEVHNQRQNPIAEEVLAGFSPNSKNDQSKKYGKIGDLATWPATRFLNHIGAKPIPGFQLKYVYFLNDSAKKRLTVPILPFSKIDEMGAGMYKGKKIRLEDRKK